jgi:hypothetical protein
VPIPELPADVPLPCEEEVTGQSIPFDRERWLAHLPDATWWPVRLDTCPRVGRWPQVDRHTVLGMAEAAGTVEGRRHLLVAALVWGTGTKVRSVNRRGRIFEEPSAEQLDHRLGAVVTMLRQEGAVAAYEACRGSLRTAHLGPAFFTKFLYFAGYHESAGPYRPLILDSVVSQALKHHGIVAANWPLNGWSTRQYAQYLDIVHRQAESAGASPHRVEAAWFTSGRRLRRSRGT